MRFSMRVRKARLRAGYTQTELAARLGVSRSSVTNWESVDRGQPATQRLQRIALVTGVSFEWLATGRGRMLPAQDLDDIPAADMEWVDDVLELRLLRAFRSAPPRMHLQIVTQAESHLLPGSR